MSTYDYQHFAMPARNGQVAGCRLENMAGSGCVYTGQVNANMPI